MMTTSNRTTAGKREERGLKRDAREGSAVAMMALADRAEEQGNDVQAGQWRECAGFYELLAHALTNDNVGFAELSHRQGVYMSWRASLRRYSYCRREGEGILPISAGKRGVRAGDRSAIVTYSRCQIHVTLWDDVAGKDGRRGIFTLTRDTYERDGKAHLAKRCIEHFVRG
jgi:hypothetical protein